MRWAISFIALLLGACAAQQAPDRVSAPAVEAAPFGELPRQTLRRGECGVVLWGKGPQPRRIAMVTRGPAAIRMLTNGAREEQIFPQTAKSGEPVFGIHPNQRFEDQGAAIELSMSMRVSARLLSGAVVEDGLLEYRDPDGLSVMAPVAGVLACR